MNIQNILKYYGSKLDLKLDGSEYYDFELTNDNQYDTDLLDLSTPLTFTSLKINDSLSGFTHLKTTISLNEIDNTINDSSYIYSGLSMTLTYSGFTSYFNTTGYSFSDILLNNNVFLYTGTGNSHIFEIVNYNQPLTVSDYFSGMTENEIMSGFSTTHYSCLNNLNGECCDLPEKLSVKPWAYQFINPNFSGTCEPIIERRTSGGWTLDFVMNRMGNSWSDGNIFYYFGVRGDDNVGNYADNNLSFGFTDTGGVKWTKIHYSGVCVTDSGYTGTNYVISGTTSDLCVTNNLKDFNITIVFKRYNKYEGCDIENEGGWNDLITGKTLINNPLSIVSGGTEQYELFEVLNKKWLDERNKRLGVLKIYLNGRLIGKFENWEEIVPSKRGVQPFIQSWGGGTPNMGGYHEGITLFDVKKFKYYEEPLNYGQIRHNFLTTQNLFDFEICGICQP